MSDFQILNPNNALARPEDYRAWEDVFATWLKNYKSPNTRKKYGSIIREFFQWVNKWFTDVTSLDLIDWRDFLENNREFPRVGKDGGIYYYKATLSDSSINLYLSAVSSFFKSGIERGLMQENPVDGVKRTSVSPYGRATYLNIERGEDLKLLGGIDTSTEKGLRDKAMILVMLTTAVRVSAIADAVADDIMNLNGQWYLSYRNKGGEKQMALLTSPVIKAIRAYLDVRGPIAPRDPLFATVKGSINSKHQEGLKLGATAITNMIARRAKAVGLHHITAHSLRHSAAVQAIKYGSVGDVQKLLKHRSNRVTLIYIDHIEDKKADEMTEKLASRYE